MFLLTFAVAGLHLNAQIWTGAVSTDWATPGNWSPLAVPGAGDTATFNANTSRDPTLGATPASIGRLNFLPGTDAESFVGTALLTINGVGGYGILNTSSQTHSFAPPIALGGSQTWENSGAGTGSLTFNGTVSLGAHTLTLASGTGKTIALGTGTGDVIDGTGALVKTGAGTVTLGGVAHTYSGGTTLQAGRTSISNNASLGTGALTLAGGELFISGDRTLTNALVLSSASTVSGAGAGPNGMDVVFSTSSVSGTGTLTVDNTSNTGVTSLGFSGAGITLAGNVIFADAFTQLRSANTTGTQTFSGVLSGAGQFVRTGAGGTSVLSSANTHSGGTTLSSGTLLLGHNSAAGTGTLTLGTGTLGSTGGTRTLANTVTLNGNTTFAAGDALVFTGPVTLNNNRSLTVLNSTTFSGDITQSGGNRSLTKSGAGTLTLSGANTYAGGTTLNSGTLLAGSNSAFGTGTLTLGSATVGSSGGTRTLANAVTLNGNTTFAAGDALVFTGPVTLNGNRTLTVLNSTTFSGNITQSGGNRSLTKSGAGTLTLSGANTYAGGTTLSAGTLVAGSNSAFGTGALTFNGGALAATGGSRTLANALRFTGNFTVGGADDLVFTGAVSHSGGNRTVTVTNTGLTTFNGALTLAENNQSRTLTFNVAGSSGGVVLNGPVLSGAGSGVDGLTKAGAGTLVFGSAKSFAGTLTLAGGTLDLGGFAHTVSTLNVTANSILDFTGASTFTAANLTVQSGFTLTVRSWTASADFFYAQTNPGAASLGRVIFEGHGPGAKWSGFDQQVTPVPEPAAAGVLLFGAATACGFLARRRRRPCPSTGG